MSTNLVAADYDGTYDFLSDEDRDSVEFIITGNGPDQYHRLYDEGVHLPIFWNPDKNDLMNIVNHKANIINKTGVTRFFEDQQIQINLLRVLCPKCSFIHIG